MRIRPSLVAIALAFLATFLLLYGIPGLIEWELVRHVNPLFACFAIGDFLGCAFLYFVGLRRTAALLYFLASVLEAYLLLSHRISSASLMWITDLLPAFVAAVVVAGLQGPDVPFLFGGRRWRH